MTTATGRIIRDIIIERGWLPGSDLEDHASRFLSSAGFRAVEVRQQHRVGRYRLDFAWPNLKIALEVDGFRHLHDPDQARRDAERDAVLRGQGWLVFRVDARDGVEGMQEQMVRVCQVVNAFRTSRRA